MIVMEDLKARGFVMKNRVIGFDQAHSRFVLKEIARIHATSLALQRDDPKLHDSLIAGLSEVVFSQDHPSNHMQNCIKKFRGKKTHKAFMRRMTQYDFIFSMFLVFIDTQYPLGSPIRNKVEAFLGDYNNNMKKIVGKNSQLCCITHGDLWVNNMLFKYKVVRQIFVGF